MSLNSIGQGLLVLRFVHDSRSAQPSKLNIVVGLAFQIASRSPLYSQFAREMHLVDEPFYLPSLSVS